MNLSDFDTIEDARNHKGYEVVSMNDAINHDAVFGVTEIMEEIRSDSEVSPALRRKARIYIKIMDGKLPTVNVMDATTQEVLKLTARR